MNISNKIREQLDQLGLVGYEQDLQLVADTHEGELKKSPTVKMGQHRDCTYFIFQDETLMKIGKVGGGTRCISKRVSDYRSTDPTGLLIKESINNNKHVSILALCFEAKVEKVHGVLTEGAVVGPKLEKALIEKAAELGMNLKWNSNRG